MSKSKKARVGHDIIAVQFPICSFNMTLKGLVGNVDPRGQTVSEYESSWFHSDELV